jgi:hypothetical protein
VPITDIGSVIIFGNANRIAAQAPTKQGNQPRAIRLFRP